MKTLNLLTLLVAFVFISCKDKHEFGDLTPPSNVNASFSIVGADNTHPHGDGTGLVNFVVTDPKRHFLPCRFRRWQDRNGSLW